MDSTGFLDRFRPRECVTTYILLDGVSNSCKNTRVEVKYIYTGRSKPFPSTLSFSLGSNPWQDIDPPLLDFGGRGGVPVAVAE
jgi:hypothetical protein